jgi:hypothetical protein
MDRVVSCGREQSRFFLRAYAPMALSLSQWMEPFDGLLSCFSNHGGEDFYLGANKWIGLNQL